VAYNAETPKMNRLEVDASMSSIAATCKIAAANIGTLNMNDSNGPARLIPKGYNRTTFNDLRPVAGTCITGAMRNLIALVVMALFAAPSFTNADIEDRLYDFTDAYYVENGVNSALIGGRMEAGTGVAVTDTPIFPSFQRDVRALLTLSAYDHSGNFNYFTVLGGFAADAFTANAAGQQAREIADSNCLDFKHKLDPV